MTEVGFRGKEELKAYALRSRSLVTSGNNAAQTVRKAF